MEKMDRTETMMKACLQALAEADSGELTYYRLLVVCKATKHKKDFQHVLKKLIKQQDILYRKGVYSIPKPIKLEAGTLMTRTKRFGFAKLDDTVEDMFIPGRYLKDALPGDRILVTRLPPRNGKTSAAISSIEQKSDAEFSGTLIFSEEDQKWVVKPDKYLPFNVVLRGKPPQEVAEGARLICQIVHRSENDDDMLASIIRSFGASDSAPECADTLIEFGKIHVSFTDELLEEAEVISSSALPIYESDLRRLDLRTSTIFTLDGADTKDIDDAVSVERCDDGYKLGVHIADVSHYVARGSNLDKEAFSRGTSIYFADRVIPMLPFALSNGICSLNELEDRLALSCLMTVSKNGELTDFSFEKTIINSKLKGVYSEVNSILASIDSEDGNNDCNNKSKNEKSTVDQKLVDKYKEVTPSLLILRELATILHINRTRRGSPEISTTESRFTVNEDGDVTDIALRIRGRAECIIEELMLLANQAAATLAMEELIPFIFRVHAPPSAERVERLCEVLTALGVSTGDVKDSPPAKVLQGIIEDSREMKYFPIVNKTVLRTMSKAEYHPENIGHYGLVLSNYAQFTSPIRRYPDLVIHRIISEYIAGESADSLKKGRNEEIATAARQSTRTELVAQQLERECEACYRAAYMRSHIGEEFEGIISHVSDRGIFVELPSTVEGRISITDMPSGEYEFDGLFSCREINSNRGYVVGDTVKVKCISVNVPGGKVDFAVE